MGARIPADRLIEIQTGNGEPECYRVEGSDLLYDYDGLPFRLAYADGCADSIRTLRAVAWRNGLRIIGDPWMQVGNTCVAAEKPRADWWSVR